MRKVNVGVLGLGRAGFMHAENLRTRINHANLIAVASDDGKAKDYAAQNQIPYHYTNLDDMLKNPEIEAVVIVSSTKFHPEHILKAMHANKHVFSEKPLGTEIADCLHLAQNMPKTDKIVTLGFMRRYDDSYALAKKMIDEGKIGKPYMVHCISQDPIYNIEGIIKFGPSSGGEFVDMSAHDLDLVNWFLNSRGKRVFATGGCYFSERFKEWNDGDNVAALIEMENGTYAILQAGRLAPHGNQTETEIQGTKGILRINKDAAKNRLEIIDSNGITIQCDPDFLYRFKEAYVNEMQQFIDNIVHKKHDRVIGIKEGLYNLIQAKTCQKAFETKTVLTFEYPKL